jgi:hypothetical protein
VTVIAPAGAVSGAGTLTATTIPASATPAAAFVGGTAAVRVTVAAADGSAVTAFAIPLDLQFPDAPVAVAPAYSHDGLTWTAIPHLMGSTTLPSGWPDGWYRDASQTLHIVTSHATYFALLTPQSTVVKALRLTFSTKRVVSLRHTRTLVLRAGSTLPATLSITLRRGSTSLGTWHPTVTAAMRTIRISLPRAALRAGRESLVLRATAAAEVAAQTVSVTFVSHG